MKLYIRIWLAIVLTIAIFAVVAGLFARNHSENLREQMRDQIREQYRGAYSDLEIKDSSGKVVGRAKPPLRRSPADLDVALGAPSTPDVPPPKRAYAITLDNGQQLELVLPSRPPPRFMRPNAPWYFSPWGFAWALGLMAIAVGLGAYPIVRRLTRRLEALQNGVDQWGAGRLSARVPVEGTDEVAALATKFNHAAAQIEALVTSHKSLLANASHELRSPLARIRMALVLLQATPDKASETTSELTQQEIQRNIQELDSLIEEILLASRLDSPEASIGTPESFDLMGLAAEECARTSTELQVADNTQGTFDMQGHPKLIRRLLRNLLENAQRHNDAAQGAVTLALTLDKQQLVITVRDHGAGVPAEECERVFEPFYRAKNASERDGGVGLGLALVKSIAIRHGGSAVCSPTQGAGGCFVVKLAA